MRHYQAMEAIKSLVPESVRHELTPKSSTVANPVQHSGINRAHHPPPPINQAQAIQMMQDNLNINEEKGYPTHLSMPTRSLNPSTVKLGTKELLNKEQTGFKELFTDYQPFYTINLLINKELWQSRK
jgi:hypothetical protein